MHRNTFRRSNFRHDCREASRRRISTLNDETRNLSRCSRTWGEGAGVRVRQILRYVRVKDDHRFDSLFCNLLRLQVQLYVWVVCMKHRL